MRNFATESGKSKGQFYTPAEVSRVVAEVVGVDPPHQPRADRLRSDLRVRLAAAEGGGRGAARDHHLRPGDGHHHLGLAKMNMIMHGAQNAEIARAT